MTRQVTPFHFIGSGEVARTEEREEKILEDGKEIPGNLVM